MPKIVEIPGVGEAEFPDGMSREEMADAITQRFKPVQIGPPPSEPETSLLRRAVADPALSLLKGAIALPEAAVGLLDIPTLGRVGSLLESTIGFKPREARESLDTLMSPAQQEATRRVSEQEGFFNTLGEAVKNPSTIGHTVLESAPSMLGGAGIARGLIASGAKVAPLVAGAIGEGVIGAGATAEEARQQSDTGTLTVGQAATAATSGAATGLISVLGGKLAKRLGVADVDTLLAGGTAPEAKKQLLRRVAESALAEGAIEELPQSAQEQIANNISQGRQWNDGVVESAATGMLAGIVMGGGASSVSIPAQPDPPAQPPVIPPPIPQTDTTMFPPEQQIELTKPEQTEESLPVQMTQGPKLEPIGEIKRNSGGDYELYQEGEKLDTSSDPEELLRSFHYGNAGYHTRVEQTDGGFKLFLAENAGDEDSIHELVPFGTKSASFQIEPTAPPAIPAETQGAIATPAIGMGAAVPGEFTPPSAGPTSIKNAKVDEERAKRGLPEAVQPARRDFGTVWDAAMAKIDSEPDYQERLLDELRIRPRALTDLEDAVILQRQIDLQNEYQKATEALSQAYDDGRTEDAELEAARVDRLSDQLLDVYTVGKAAGTETGRGLNARKMMANEDFTLASLETKKRAAKGGAPLTDQERSELQKIADDYKKANEKLEQANASKDERIAELESIAAQKEIVKPVKPSQPNDPNGAAGDIDGIKAGIAAKVESGAPTEITGLVQKLARYFVSQGVRERNALIDAVHGVLVDIVPEITRRDTMDAISGYGKYKLLTKNEIDVQLRDLKGQMQQVGKLEDMQAGEAPKKTGVERRQPSDEERRLIKQVEEAKKKGGYKVTDPETQLRSALQAIQTRLENQIKDLEFEISTRTRIVKQKGVTPSSPEIDALKSLRDFLKAERDAIFGKREMTDEQRIRLATASLERSIADYEQRIKNADISPRKRGSKTPVTPELEALRSRREALRDQLQELRDLANPKKTPEERALQSYKTRTKNRIAELEEKLSRGDFTSKPKRETVKDPEATRLEFELEKVKRRYYEGLFKDKLANRTKVQKVFGTIGEIANTAKSIVASIDLSAVGRQGLGIVLAHPIRASQSLGPMFKALKSDKGQFEVDQEIQNRRNSPLYRKAKLFLSTQKGALSEMEEVYMSRWADKIPGIKASQRAYTTFLNRLRADSFDAMVATLAKDGQPTLVEAKAIANFVNVATGRGSFGVNDNPGAVLSTIFFSPRYAASRFQFLLGQPLYGGTGRTRKLVAQEYGRFLTGVAVVYALASAAGDDEIETDPRSSDFGKIIIGSTRIDPMAGLIQVTVLLSRLGTGETISSRGRPTPIYGPRAPYGGADGERTVGKFLRAKLSPAPSTAVDLTFREDFLGRETTPASIASKLTPITIQEIHSAMKEHGVPAGVALSILAIFGIGIQTYDE